MSNNVRKQIFLCFSLCSSQTAQPQRLGRALRFKIDTRVIRTVLAAQNKGADQTDHMSLVVRKPVFGVSDQVLHKPDWKSQKMARGLKFRI